MENTKTIILELRLTRNKLLFLLSLFFLAWHPAIINSETLTLTTYYPAPYGGYASLLTTGRTLLARDGSNVGIHTAFPTATLHVVGGFTLENADKGDGNVLTSDANGHATWKPASSPYYYQCPSHPESIGGGFWGFYGCQGQISQLSTCYTMESGNPASPKFWDCAPLGKIFLQ
jgi:hypothetical protein